eukprot:4807207-Pyramimonas_sp.AAC.1
MTPEEKDIFRGLTSSSSTPSTTSSTPAVDIDVEGRDDDGISQCRFGLSDVSSPLSLPEFEKALRSVMGLPEDAPLGGFSKYGPTLRDLFTKALF